MEIFLIIISISPVINQACLHFEDKSTTNIKNYCHIKSPKNLTQNSFRECFECVIQSEYIKVTHEAFDDRCKDSFECIEFHFSNNQLFEKFFHDYGSLLSTLFRTSTKSPERNSLVINIVHDTYQELSSRYIKSILQPNGSDYLFLTFSLTNHTELIVLDLETNFAELPIYSLRIRMVCNGTPQDVYEINHDTKRIINSSNCIITRRNFSATLSTTTIHESTQKNASKSIFNTTRPSTIDFIPKTNMFLFIGGLIVFTIWILCICLCLYLRYYKWKVNHGLNQRSSIVSSMFSVDSFDNRKTEILLAQQKNPKPKQFGHFSLSSYESDF